MLSYLLIKILSGNTLNLKKKKQKTNEVTEAEIKDLCKCILSHVEKNSIGLDR